MPGGLYWLSHQAYLTTLGSTPAPDPPGTSYADTLIALSPTAYWRLGDASGNFADSSGNGYTMTAGGTPIYNGVAGWTGDGDGAVTFTGDDYGTISTAAWMNPGTNDFSVTFVITMSAWPGTTSQVIGHDGQGQLGQWTIILRGLANGIRCELYDATTGTLNADLTAPSGVLQDGNPHHVVITFDRSGLATLYVDGSSASTVSIASASAYNLTNSRALWLAASNATPNEPLTATLDEVAFWNSTLLTAGNVTTLYAARNA